MCKGLYFVINSPRLETFNSLALNPKGYGVYIKVGLVVSFV
jgi:hypothetical protein